MTTLPAIPDVVVTFRTTSGAFTIPAALFDDGLEYELARYFATHMPEGAKSAGRDVLPNGAVVVRWRRIEVVRLAG